MGIEKSGRQIREIQGILSFMLVDEEPDSPDYGDTLPDAEVDTTTLEFTFPCEASESPDGRCKVTVYAGQSALSLIDTVLEHQEIHLTPEEATIAKEALRTDIPAPRADIPAAAATTA